MLIRRLVLSPEVPWERQRSRMAAALMTTHIPRSVTRRRTDIAGVPAEVLSCNDGRDTATLVHLHGGGFAVGSPLLARAWSAALCKRLGITVILPDYRLAPEHPFPAARQDAAAVIDHVLGIRPSSKVAVSGDSAGANLVLGDAVARAEATTDLPAAMVLLSPWLDLTDDRLGDPALVARDPMMSPEWLAACATAYAPGRWSDPGVSPLLGPLGGLPPLLVQGGSDDVLAPDAARLVAALGDAGDVTYSVAAGLWHDFSLQIGTLAAADDALDVTIEHLTVHLALDAR